MNNNETNTVTDPLGNEFDRIVSPATEDRHYEMPHSVLTVGMLRELLADVPDDTHVLTDGYTTDWLNINVVVIPGTEGDYSAVTLYGADTFDPRQF